MAITFDLNQRERACFIFGAGTFYGIKNEPKDGDLVIAADGGLMYLEKLGIVPDVILGDFDSGSADGAKQAAERHAEKTKLVPLSAVKDRSDSAAALLYGKERGYCLFYLYGCTGARLDHTLATIQDLAAFSKEGMQAYLFDDKAVLTALSNGAISFPETMRGTISVFSHSDSCRRVRESGLKYLVADQVLDNAFPLGLSNEFTGMPSRVSVGEGTLILYISLP